MTEWRKVSLGEAGVLVIDCDHKTPPATSSGYPYVAIPQMREGRLDLSTARRILEQDYIAWTRKAKPRVDDVVLSRRTNPGESARMPRDLEFAVGQNLLLLRSDGSSVYPPFLRWLVRGPEWWDEVRKYINVGAVFDSLRLPDIPKFMLRMPPIDEQRVIASALDALDDKIESNRRLIDGISRLLPVEISTTVSHDLAGTVALDAIAERVNEVVSPEEIGDAVPYIGLEHMPRGSLIVDNWGSSATITSAKARFRRGDVLFGKLRPYFRKVGVAPIDGVCSTDILVLRPRAAYPLALLATTAASAEVIEYVSSAAVGTKMPRASWEYLAAWQTSVPGEGALAYIESALTPMIDRGLAAVLESRRLTEIRDTLLPELLSGRLRSQGISLLAEAAV